MAGMGKTRERATHQRRCVRVSVRVLVPWCFLAHSLATLGHETAASTTTSIMRKAAPLRGGAEKYTAKPTAQKNANGALLSDKALSGLILRDLDHILIFGST